MSRDRDVESGLQKLREYTKYEPYHLTEAEAWAVAEKVEELVALVSELEAVLERVQGFWTIEEARSFARAALAREPRASL